MRRDDVGIKFGKIEYNAWTEGDFCYIRKTTRDEETCSEETIVVPIRHLCGLSEALVKLWERSNLPDSFSTGSAR